MQPFNQASFVLSAPSLADLPEDNGRELLMLGRSNVGKSSLINALCGQKSLAKTSKTPGRTRLLNVYTLEAEARLIDAPGYGFAKVSRSESARWIQLIQDYVQHRQSLAMVFLVMDIRHPLQPQDMVWLDFIDQIEGETWIVLNKMDAFGRGKQMQAQRVVQDYCKKSGIDAQILLCSAQKKQGLDALLATVRSGLCGK